MKPNTTGNFVSVAATLAELEQKAAECERQGATQPEPDSMELREKAMLYRAWIAQLRSGPWTSLQG
jgi:hypothetical protein